MQPTEGGTKTKASDVDGHRRPDVDFPVIRLGFFVLFVRIGLAFNAIVVTSGSNEFEETIQQLGEVDFFVAPNAKELLRSRKGAAISVRAQPITRERVFAEMEVPKVHEIPQSKVQKTKLDVATSSGSSDAGVPMRRNRHDGRR